MPKSELPVNVLLVMDDPNVFDIRERLADSYDFWGISSVPSVQKAMQLLETDSTIDAVVAGHRIADMDGRDFLEQLRHTHPNVARLVVAQSAQRGRSMEAAGVAHTALGHPVDTGSLQEALERSVAMRWRLNDPDLHEALSQMGDLPTPPAGIVQLATVLAEPRVEVGDVAAIVKSDPGMASTLLHLVNSAAFGLPQRMTDIDQIVAYLGLLTVRNVLAADRLLAAFDAIDPEVKADVDLHREHAQRVAAMTQNLLTDRTMKADAYVAGLLHDIGLLALMTCAPVRYLALRQEVMAGQRSMWECELDIVGATHATVGAHVLEQWLLPASICEAVGRSHDADEMSVWKPDIAHAVFVAETMVGMDASSSWWEAPHVAADAYYQALGWEQAV